MNAMKRMKFWWIAAGLMIGCGGAVGLHQWRAAEAADAARAEQERLRRAAQAELQEWKGRALAAKDVRAAFQPESVAGKASSKPKPVEKKVAEPEPTIMERLQKDPEYQVLTLAAERAHLLSIYGALFHKLGLTSEQIAQFQQISFNAQERHMDLRAIMAEKNLTWQDSAISKLYQDNVKQLEADQRALLGDEGYKVSQDYEHTRWVREMMIGWAGGAAVVLREPFTPQQGEQLVQIMANASESYRKGGHVETSTPGYWEAVEAEARKVLTPTQFVYFSTMEPPLPAGARYQTAFYNKVHEAMTADQKAGGEKKPGGG